MTQPRADRDATRRGMILPLAIAILVVLAVMAMAVHLLRQQTYKSLSFIDGYLNVVAVGEACFVRTVERLRTTPWSQRWFRDGPKSGDGTWMDGRYEYLIGDAPSRGEVDLVVWASLRDARVSMHWRLLVDPYTLTAYREIKTSWFRFLGDEDPVGPAGLPGIVASLDPAIRERTSNRDWVDDVQTRILQADGPGRIPGLLGLPADGMAIDLIPPTGPGGSSRPVGPGSPNGPGTAPDPGSIAPQGGSGGVAPPPGPDEPATPATAVALGTAIAQLHELKTQYEDALKFITRGENKVISLLQEVQPFCAAGLPPACTCVGAGEALLRDIRQVKSDLQASQAELTAGKARIDAAIAPPGPTEEQARNNTIEVQQLIDGTPDPCVPVNGLVDRTYPTLAPCGDQIVSQSFARDEVAGEVRGLRGKNGTCAP